MSKWLVVLSYVAGASLSWGVDVPVVHRAAFELKSNLRAFMFVGAAYFIVAVLIPAFFIFVAKFDSTVKPRAVPNFHLHASLWGWPPESPEQWGLSASSSQRPKPDWEPRPTWRLWSSAAPQSSTHW